MAVVFHGSRAQLRQVLGSLPSILAGRVADPLRIARGLQLRVGVALLSRVQQAFVVKSRGGTGDDGIKWKPMKPASIAQRRTTAAERRQLGIGGRNRTRGLLTPTQDRRWRKIFGSRKAALIARYGMSEAAASARAAQIAWAVLKAEGAQTKLAVLGGRQVDICRDTGRYFRSLSPGVDDQPSGADGQVFDVPPGRVIVGTNVAYAGRQAKLRPPWPAGGRLPAAWWAFLLRVAVRGLARAARLLVEGAHP